MKYITKLLSPNPINVPIKDIAYIIPIGLLLLKAPAIIASPKGDNENIKVLSSNPTIDIKKVTAYRIIFCFANNLFSTSFALTFLFSSIYSSF